MRTYLFVILCINKLFNSIQFNGWIDGWIHYYTYPTQLFTSKLTHILTQIPLNTLIILGDFNYHYDENKYPHNSFKQTIETLSLKQHI